MVLVVARKSANAVRRKKFRLVQHAAEHALELFAVHEGEEPAHAARGTLRHFDVFGYIRMIVNEPLHASLEAGEAIDAFRLERRMQRSEEHTSELQART